MKPLHPPITPPGYANFDLYAPDDPDYPSSDGMPMSDNTLQYDWIVAIQGGIDNLFRDRPDVFVAGDLLWYPVEGDNTVRAAPDALVAFGRPKGHRGSYIQHREGGIAPQVVFEILSPGNRAGEMRRKLAFYEQYGPAEYYILDPDHAKHKGYRRNAAGKLVPIPDLFGFTSPLLGIRFEMTREMKEELRVIAPDGRPFQLLPQIFEELHANERRAAEERERADGERERADGERERADAATARAERLLAQLRALGMEPEA